MNISTVLLLFQVFTTSLAPAKEVCMSAAVKIFIAGVDFYHKISKMLQRAVNSLLYWLMRFLYPKYVKISKLKYILKAVQDGRDVTPLVTLWYWSTSVHTCNSLLQFLDKYGSKSSVVKILYSWKTKLYMVKIDLDSEMELLSGEHLPFGSIDIDDINGKPLEF